MDLSVVIITYNRASLLHDALKAMGNQTAKGDRFEVIVVDNNSTDNTKSVVKKAMKSNGNIRYVFEEQQGASFARNRGCREAVSDWIAYLDDDAIAHKDYVERALHIIDHYNFDCFGGVFMQWYRDGKPKWYQQSYGSNIDVQKETGELAEGKYFSAGNCVFKKSVLETIATFSTAIGPKGEEFAYGEETHLQRHLRKAGCIIGFDPKLLIDHHVAPHKQYILWFLKSAFKSGQSSWAVYEKKVSLYLLVKNMAAIVILPLLYIPNNVWKLFFRHDYYWQNFVIDTFRRSASALGRVVSGIRYKLLMPSCKDFKG